MNAKQIQKAVEYKQGHLNMIQYILIEKPEWTISVYDKEQGIYAVEKSKDYEAIRKAIKDYETEILIFNTEDRQIGWANFIPYNDTDEDIVSDYSNTLTLNAWAKQFEKLHEKIKEVE